MKNFFRLVRGHKSSSFITIFGFAAGLSAALLLLIFIQHELSYDQHWPHGDHIFRMSTTLYENSNLVEFPICLRKAFTQLPAEVPGIEAAVQIYRTRNPEIALPEKRFRNLHFFYVDSTFFSVFRMQAVAGDLNRALQTPDALVLNQTTARQLFGDTDPIGQTISVSEYSLQRPGQPFRIAAIVPDLPGTSHFDFDVLLPMATNQNTKLMGGLEYYTYYLLRSSAPLTATLAEIDQVYRGILQRWADNLGDAFTPGSRLIPLKDIYLNSQTRNELGPTGDAKTIRIFALLTGLILLIAIANFVNLFLVQGSKRSLETGMRRTLGATRLDLIRHFMKESFLMSGISFLIALYLVSILVTPFANLVRRPLTTDALLQPQYFLGIVGLFLLVAIFAGAYPAWFLSRPQPLQALKGVTSTGKPKQRLRKGIVLLQFGICMLLLTNLLVLQAQFDYMNSQPLGFDAKNVVAYRNLSPKLQEDYALIKNDLLQYPDVTGVTGSHSRPGEGASGQTVKCFGRPDDSSISVREVRVQPDYFQTYGMKLKVGRSFSADRPADRSAVILNEAAVRALDLTEPIGSRVLMFDDPLDVIGVVDDYHYSSLRDPIQPEIFTYYRDQIFTVSIRVQSGSTPGTTERINAIFNKYDPEYVPDYVFLNDAFAAMYGGEYRLIQLVRGGAVLAVILTILGLGAILATTIQQRTKEIGVRKVVGASSHEIVRMLIGSELAPLIVTTLLAGLMADWTIGQWLENYAFRIEMSWLFFLASGLLLLSIAAFVTIIISYRAALANPVEALHYE